MSRIDHLFQSGVSAAEAGDLEQARSLLLQVVEENPHHEEAWMWLCDFVDSREDRLIALENVLTINPKNHDARVLLETLQSAGVQAAENTPRVFSAVSTEPLKRPVNPWEETSSILEKASSPTTPIKDRRVMQARSRSRLMAAHRALSAGDREAVLNILVQMVEEDENSKEAWFLLGHMAPTVEDQRIALENVLILNPENRAASLRLEKLEQLADEYVLETLLWEKEDTLLKIVENFLGISADGQKPANGIQKAAGPNGKGGLEQGSKQNPTLHLFRIALWPTLLFILLIVIQSFLKLLSFTPLFILGALSVLVGSALAAAASSTPRHPLWVDYFGEPGEQLEKTASWIFGGLGWLLAVGPFIIFFAYAAQALTSSLALTG